jgi:hypothetical protein
MPTPDEAAGALLARTVLRDFGPPDPQAERDDLPMHVTNISRYAAPIPVLLRHALTLIGVPHGGPGEKVAWWTSFTYKGHSASLAHQKFGLRLRIRGEFTDEQVGELMSEMTNKLTKAVRTVEDLLASRASATLSAGNVTVVNQHRHLRRAYDYFRERATNPELVEDKSESGTNEFGTWSTFLLGKNVMAMNAGHDLIAAISAFVSSLEHDLVLSLPFLDYDPSRDNLTNIIGDKWGDKWRRVVGHQNPEAVRLRERLTAVVERWRNPYSHGGFEKGNGATIYLHTLGLGALPVGLSRVRDSPLFSFHSASDTEIEDVFILFDQIDAFLASHLPHAMEWINSGLDVRFDAEFMRQVVRSVQASGNLEKLIGAHAYRQEMHDNMDY